MILKFKHVYVSKDGRTWLSLYGVIVLYVEYFVQIFFRLGHAVAYLVEALRYKSEGRGFDSR